MDNLLLADSENWNFLSSQADGKGGTSFDSSSGPKENIGRSKDAKIVIVDDDPMIKRLFTVALKRAGFNVVNSLDDGKELIEFISDLKPEEELKRPDVVLLDWTMPNLDGLETAKTLRAGFPTLKIVMVSAYALPNEAKGYFDAHLRKPVSLDDLLTTVSRVIGS